MLPAKLQTPVSIICTVCVCVRGVVILPVMKAFVPQFRAMIIFVPNDDFPAEVCSLLPVWMELQNFCVEFVSLLYVCGMFIANTCVLCVCTRSCGFAVALFNGDSQQVEGDRHSSF